LYAPPLQLQFDKSALFRFAALLIETFVVALPVTILVAPPVLKLEELPPVDAFDETLFVMFALLVWLTTVSLALLTVTLLDEFTPFPAKVMSFAELASATGAKALSKTAPVAIAVVNLDLVVIVFLKFSPPLFYKGLRLIEDLYKREEVKTLKKL